MPRCRDDHRGQRERAGPGHPRRQGGMGQVRARCGAVLTECDGVNEQGLHVLACSWLPFAGMLPCSGGCSSNASCSNLTPPPYLTPPTTPIPPSAQSPTTPRTTAASTRCCWCEEPVDLAALGTFSLPMDSPSPPCTPASLAPPNCSIIVSLHLPPPLLSTSALSNELPIPAAPAPRSPLPLASHPIRL